MNFSRFNLVGNMVLWFECPWLTFVACRPLDYGTILSISFSKIMKYIYCFLQRIGGLNLILSFRTKTTIIKLFFFAPFHSLSVHNLLSKVEQIIRPQVRYF